jgi:hypothetical protein
VFETHVSFDIPVKSIFVLPIKIVIPLDIFQQHLPEVFFQLEVRKMEFDEMPIRIIVQKSLHCWMDYH